MDRRVALMSGREAVSIDVASRRITLDDGKVLSFDRLVLAIGATAREFSTSEGIESVFTLHVPDDARQLRAALAAARSVLIITGGYIGRKILATLTNAGKKVTIIEATARVCARSASPPVSAFFEARHRNAGVHVIIGKSLAEIQSQNEKFLGATLKGGHQIDADILVVGIGVTPNTHLPKQAAVAVMGSDLPRRQTPWF